MSDINVFTRQQSIIVDKPSRTIRVVDQPGSGGVGNTDQNLVIFSSYAELISNMPSARNGVVAVTTDYNRFWVHTNGKWVLYKGPVHIFANETERDAAIPAPTNGEMCYLANRRWVYSYDSIVGWSAWNTTHTKIAAANNIAYSSIAAANTVICTVPLVVATGTNLRLRIAARAYMDLSSATLISEGWAYDIFVHTSLVARERFTTARAGAQPISFSLSTILNHTTIVDNPNVTGRLTRLTGSGLATGAVDSSLNRMELEYAAAHPF